MNVQDYIHTVLEPHLQQIQCRTFQNYNIRYNKSLTGVGSWVMRGWGMCQVTLLIMNVCHLRHKVQVLRTQFLKKTLKDTSESWGKYQLKKVSNPLSKFSKNKKLFSNFHYLRYDINSLISRKYMKILSSLMGVASSIFLSMERHFASIPAPILFHSSLLN